MSRPSVLILLGIAILVLPFLGLPSVLRAPLLAVIGGYVLGIGISLRSQHRTPESVS